MTLKFETKQPEPRTKPIELATKSQTKLLKNVLEHDFSLVEDLIFLSPVKNSFTMTKLKRRKLPLFRSFAARDYLQAIHFSRLRRNVRSAVWL